MKTDFFDIKSLLSQDELIMLDEARKFTVKEIIPIIAEFFEKDEFPRDLIPKIAAMGFLGIKTVAKYGGLEANYMMYGIICQELERGDSGIRSFVSVQNSLVMYPIEQFGSEEQKNKWLPLLAQGTAIGCFGLTEADAGSNPSAMKTCAVKRGNEYIINGSKMWITNGNIADVSIVWAKTDTNDPAGKSIRGFLVEKDRPGFSANKIKHKLSLRASETGELVLNDVVVPEENMLPQTVVGLRAPLMCLDQARYGISWGVIGAAMECYETALEYAKTRIQFKGKPIAAHQLIQASLVKMLTEITKAQFLSWKLGKLMDEGRATPAQISMAKMNNAEMALDTARLARDILGANGVSLEYPIIRHMNNLESVHTYEGTSNIHKLIIGKEITGISAFF